MSTLRVCSRSAGLCLAAFLWLAVADSTVVFNEIMYHPASGEATLEWIELYNQMAVDMDLSGWSLQGGVRYEFPEDTILQGGGYLVVAISPPAMQAAVGLTKVLGPFLGRLANEGETIELRDNCQRLMDSLRYDHEDGWPAGADGGGPSLAKRNPDTASGLAESWTSSAEVGGTPGARNFPAGVAGGRTTAASRTAVGSDSGAIVFSELMYHHRPYDPVRATTSETTLVPFSTAWRYNDSGTDLGAAWRAPGYEDGAWPSGLAPLAANTGSLPAPTNTVISPGRNPCYFRTTFHFSGAPSRATLALRSVVDDGAVLYLNGEEIHRQNMPVGPVEGSTWATAAVGDAGYVGPITLPAGSLAEGLNVLAVEVHQSAPAAASSGLVLNGGGLTLVEEGPFGGVPPMNLARQPGVTPFVIDSLAGYPIHDYLHLNDGVYGNANSWIGHSGAPGYAGLRFGGRFVIHGIAFGRDNLGNYNDRTLGLYTLEYTRVAAPGAATAFTGNPDTGWAAIGTLDYQKDGTGPFANPSRRHRFTFTPVEATGLRLLVPGTGMGGGTCIDELEVNPPDAAGDVAFDAELVLTTTLSPATPFTESTEEWVELHNRSPDTVDLGDWRIAGGIGYRFPIGTVISAGGYVVVANDAGTLQAQWPEVASMIVGDFSGRMSAGETVILKDARDNPVDTVWVRAAGWSDGGGSSLELTDARADNSNPGVWADSDESTKSGWQTVTYRMVAGQTFGSTFWNEFRLGLLDAGEVLVDDVSVIRDPAGARQQLIQNGHFEIATGNTHWRMLGNHRHSQILTDPDSVANHVLRVSATSAARTSHNHIESSFAANTPVVDGDEYEVSYRARWLAGSPQVNTSAYMAKLARTTLLSLPSRHGTPGAVNSRHVSNAGPTFTELKHTPTIPLANQAVTISVSATDPDGVALATLAYRVNPGTSFTRLPMTLGADGAWEGHIPGQAAGRVVQFHVSAQDGLGASASAPARASDSRALYQVADSQGTTLRAHELRLIQLDADRDFLLHATNVMSQDLTGGTLVYDRSEVFYDVGVRLHGSAAGRARDGDDSISYTLAFPSTHLFRGVQREINIDRSGRSPVPRRQDEIYILHLFHRAGIPCHYSDLCYFIAPKPLHTGTAILQMSVYSGLFVKEQYPVDGSVFNDDLTYEPSTTADGTVEGIKLPVPLQPHLGTDFTDLGSDQEQYRAPFGLRHGTRADDYSNLIRLCQTMALPQAEFDARIADALDVDEALRITALTLLCGIGDSYFPGGLPHNLRLFAPADRGPVHFLPWDMDFVFSASPSSSIYPGSNYNLFKLILHSTTKRLYLAHMLDLCQTVFTPAAMGPWLAHYGSVAGQDFSAGSSYIQARRTYAVSQLPAPEPFAITSNGGSDFLAHATQVTIAGRGWLDIRAIRLDGRADPLTVNWPTLTDWEAPVPLLFGRNRLTFLACDRHAQPLATDSITVTCTLPGGGRDGDGDGMPDLWEAANGLDPGVNDACLDPDGDGLTNHQEYLAGTAPSDARSRLQLDAAGVGDQVHLSFNALAGRTYSVLAREVLGQGEWIHLRAVPAEISDRVVTVVFPADVPHRFFQLATP